MYFQYKYIQVHLSCFVSQGPYDVVLLPGGMPGAQNLAEVKNTQITLHVKGSVS